MASTGSVTALCAALVLTAFVQSGWGSSSLRSTTSLQVGSINIMNAISEPVALLNIVYFIDGTSRQDASPYTMAPGSTTTMAVMDDYDCVGTEFRTAVTNATLGQNLPTWCTTNMPVNCLPDCWWFVEQEGFFVGRAREAHSTFVAGWILWARKLLTTSASVDGDK